MTNKQRPKRLSDPLNAIEDSAEPDTSGSMIDRIGREADYARGFADALQGVYELLKGEDEHDEESE